MAHDELLIALAAVRLSPLFLLLLVIASLGISARPPASPSVAAIRNVVVADVQPRRALILTLLTFAAFTYLLDGILVAVIAVVDGVRQGATEEWRGVEAADAAGVLAFASLAILGTVKDAKGVDFWTRKRVKAFSFFALAFDIAYLALMLLTIPIFPYSDVPQAPGSPSGLNVPNFLHFIAVDVRLLILLPLFPILLKPATTYSPLQRPPPSPAADALLLPGAAHQPAYGTFTSDVPETSMKPGSPPATKAPEGYDVEANEASLAPDAPLLAPSAPPSRRSSRRSHHSHRSRDFEPVAAPAITDEPEPLAPQPDPQVNIVTENPPTDNPNELRTDYAAVAATALDKEANADDKRSDEAGSSSKHDHSNQSHAPYTGDAPVSFPTADDASSIRSKGITFSPEAQATPRSGTPEPETASLKEKRKRTASQNFQRLARRVSLVPKRQGSTSSSTSGPSSTPKKDGSTGSGFLNMMKLRREESNASGASGEGSTNRVESPTPSVPGSEDAKKEKKKKRMSIKI